MNSAENQPDYDYIISDSNGHRKVKDGKEYPMTEEEWRRENPEHKDTGCEECSFASNQETILTYFVDREQKALQKIEKPIFIGKFTLPGWVGHSGFYFFSCQSCGKSSIDYIHANSRGPYFYCQHCGDYFELNPVDHRDILVNEGFNFSEADVGYYKKYCHGHSLARLIFVRVFILLIFGVTFFWLFL